MLRPRFLPSLAAVLTTALLVVGLTTGPVRAGSDPERVPVAAAKPVKDPRKRLGLFVDHLMPAAQQGSPYATAIGKKAQALWFGIEYYPTNRVQGIAKAYVQRAVKARKTPMMVVYSIPKRDCGQHSAGGAANGAVYKRWITKLAAGIKGTKPLVILEPDAIPFMSVDGCGSSDWTALLRFATRKLSAAGAWVYLDAGHSGWTPYTGRALLLKRAGIAYARGLSTNVSNFRPLADEKTYATGLIRELRGLGVTGVKYVVDTSRNGYAHPVDGDVINPTWARLGLAPRLVFKGPFDGTLWVKHPGESDGEVNGGPPSGQWCDLLADRLLGRTGTGNC